MAFRPTWAEVDRAAIRHNTRLIADLVAPAQVCAVVKAYGYGHGPVQVADAALNAGATWLGVALVDEGAHLRVAGQFSEPILLLSEPPYSRMDDVVAHGLTPTVYTSAAVEAAAKAVASSARREPLPVHVKVDTGMHRVGAAPDAAVQLALAVNDSPELRLEGLWTHFAVADEPDHPFTGTQIERFDRVIAELAAHDVRPALVHAANSAGALTRPDARYDMVRCGIALYGLAPSPALYGLAPSPALNGLAELRPALALKAQVTLVKRVDAGEAISYGLRYRLARPAFIATVPIGYADGVPRRLADVGGEVLIAGRRRPIAGTVTMDQITVDCGDDETVAAGDEVVLIGRQGDDEIGAWDWARRLDTIAYEIVSGISRRVPFDYR
jgi:alanine racemase